LTRHAAETGSSPPGGALRKKQTVNSVSISRNDVMFLAAASQLHAGLRRTQEQKTRLSRALFICNYLWWSSLAPYHILIKGI
jgi:hypothetical protein